VITTEQRRELGKQAWKNRLEKLHEWALEAEKAEIEYFRAQGADEKTLYDLKRLQARQRKA
jgi:hypothetical protein